jgi:hypothetical protein
MIMLIGLADNLGLDDEKLATLAAMKCKYRWEISVPIPKNLQLINNSTNGP